MLNVLMIFQVTVYLSKAIFYKDVIKIQAVSINMGQNY
jgi:hypothetical protein